MVKVIIDKSEEVFKEDVKQTPYEKRNENLKEYINRHKICIDKTVFKKTKEEKELLSKLKNKFKNR